MVAIPYGKDEIEEVIEESSHRAQPVSRAVVGAPLGLLEDKDIEYMPIRVLN